MAIVVSTAGRLIARLPDGAFSRTAEQVTVAGAQMAAGAGNLLFIVLVARILNPTEFALVAGFLALFLLLHLFAESITSASALAPQVGQRHLRRIAAVGLAVGVALAAGAVPLAPLVGVPSGMLFALAATAPMAGLLALQRGRLYGEHRHGRLVVSLLAEPATRLVLGLALATAYGSTAVAVAVVGGTGVALVVVSAGGTTWRRAGISQPSERRQPGSVAVTFVLLAVIQTVGLALANGFLNADEAARFAAAVTIGGIATFATATIPLVLLSRAATGERSATVIAVALSAGIGGIAVLFALSSPDLLVQTVLGSQYGTAAELAAPYMAAMAMLGVARVLAAHGCATGRGSATVRLVTLAMLAQLALLFTLGASATGMTAATLYSVGGLTIALGAQLLFPAPAPREALGIKARLAAVPVVPALISITAGGLVLRLLLNRGLWVDEAISVAQAEMPFGDMLHQIRSFDVHPPLHHMILWLVVRAAGSGEVAVRTPSIVCGTLLIPMMFVLGRELYGRRTGLLAAGGVALSPLLIWYSQEARMYGLLTLLSVTAVWLQVRATRRGGMWTWLGLGVTLAAMVWTHYLAGGIQAMIQIGILAVALTQARAGGRPLRPMIIGVAVALTTLVVIVAPLVPFAHDQFTTNEAVANADNGLKAPAQAGVEVGGHDSDPTIYTVIANISWAMWGYHPDATMLALGALWPLAILLALGLLGKGRPRDSGVLLAIVVGTIVVLFALGFVQENLFEIRYAIGTVPLLILLAARGLDRFAPRKGLLVVGASLVSLTMVLGLVDQQLNRSNPRQFDFADVLGDVSSRAVPGDVIVFQPSWMKDVVHYYAPHVTARPLGLGIPKVDARSRIFLTVVSIGPTEQLVDNDVRVSEARAELRSSRPLLDRFTATQITAWVY